MIKDITEYFNSLIEQYDSIDIANHEFKKAVAEDDELRALYREWCHEFGSTEKNGFLDYCDAYKESRDNVWESLKDYDDDNY